MLALSVGVDIDPDGAKLTGDVLNVSTARGKEVSLTPVPAFQNSRVTAVSLHNEGVTVTTETEVTPVTVTLDSTGIGEAIATAFAQLPQAQPVPLAQVTEPSLYRFDGGRNQYEFSSDLIAMSTGDGDAKGRIERFMSETFAIDAAGTSALNVPRARPDLYVDQHEYSYPIWDAVNKGTLQDGTPFVLPKFSASSGLVSNHVTGVEPSPGSFTATAQTITPSAVSGRVEIPREVWDQGGSPQLSGLVWRQITRAYYEALEAFVVAGLDALTPTALTITAGATDDTLEGDLTAALASLQYIRGGNRFRDLFVQVDLYKALIAAQDGDGRKLFPVLAPANATGTTDPFFGSVLVGGLRAIPAWALAPTGTTPTSSYLLDRGDVSAWATAPQRLSFEYRVAYIDLAVWGYKAFACTDLTGVREVTYDPTA